MSSSNGTAAVVAGNGDLFGEVREAVAGFRREMREFGGLVRSGKATTVLRRVCPRKLRVLIVEDDPDWVMVAAETLKDGGFDVQVSEACCPDSMSEAIRAFKPEVILCDHRMPAFSASEAYLVSRRLCPDVPFVVLSGTMSPEAGGALIEIGAAAWVRKDDVKVLPGIVSRELERPRS